MKIEGDRVWRWRLGEGGPREMGHGRKGWIDDMYFGTGHTREQKIQQRADGVSCGCIMSLDVLVQSRFTRRIRISLQGRDAESVDRPDL